VLMARCWLVVHLVVGYAVSIVRVYCNDTVVVLASDFSGDFSGDFSCDVRGLVIGSGGHVMVHHKCRYATVMLQRICLCVCCNARMFCIRTSYAACCSGDYKLGRGPLLQLSSKSHLLLLTAFSPSGCALLTQALLTYLCLIRDHHPPIHLPFLPPPHTPTHQHTHAPIQPTSIHGLTSLPSICPSLSPPPACSEVKEHKDDEGLVLDWRRAIRSWGALMKNERPKVSVRNDLPGPMYYVVYPGEDTPFCRC